MRAHNHILILIRNVCLFAILPICFIGCTSPLPADLILYNGKIITVDSLFSIQEAIVIRGNKILAVGSNTLRGQYKAKQEIDLNGKTLLPGFNDTHIHISGAPTREIDLRSVKSIDEIATKIHEKIVLLGEGQWISGYGWAEDNLAEQRNPTREDLDRIAPKNPVMLIRAGGHSSVSNSLALKLAGIDKNTPDPESGMIEHASNGLPNGIIRERNDLVARLIPEATFEEVRPNFIKNLNDLFSLGITSIVPAGQTIREYGEWEHVYADSSNNLPRASVQIYWAGAEAMKAFGKKSGDGTDYLRVGAVKILTDGGFTGPSAYTLAPYKGQASFRGTLNYKEQELRSIIMDAHQLGWQMGFHTIGDGAIKLTVDYFAEALTNNPKNNHRHYLNHFTILPPEETLQKMADFNILISQQPNFTYTLEKRYVDNLEGARLAHNNPLRTPMNHGIFVALSSDILPIGPMVGIYAAVTRKGKSGAVYGLEEALTIEEAIRGYTRNAAYITFEENIKGSLEPGKLADMIILSKDPLTIASDSLMTVAIEQTFLGGKLVYSRK